VSLGSAYLGLPVSSGSGLNSRTVNRFPDPASSNRACPFRSLGFPCCFSSRVMRPIVPERLSELPRNIVVHSVIGSRMSLRAPWTTRSRIEGMERTLANSRVSSLDGHYSASSLLLTPPTPSRLPPISRCSRLYGFLFLSISGPGRGGSLQLLGVSLPSCCRFNPARVVRRISQLASSHAAFTLRKRARLSLGLPLFEAKSAFTFVTAR
jgi:hypothetical protein